MFHVEHLKKAQGRIKKNECSTWNIAKKEQKNRTLWVRFFVFVQPMNFKLCRAMMSSMLI